MGRIVKLITLLMLIISLVGCGEKQATSASASASQAAGTSAAQVQGTDQQVKPSQGETSQVETPEEELKLPRPLTLDNRAEFIRIAEQLGEKNTFEVEDNKLEWLFVDGALIVYCDNFDLPDNAHVNLPWADFKSEIKEIIIADGCTYIEENLDIGCGGAENLEVVLFPNGITNTTHVLDCPKLTYVYIPDTVRTIGMFRNCTSLKEISIPDGVTSLYNTFYGCTSLEKADIPDSVEKLQKTFDDCTSLKEVSLPSNLKSLDGITFRNCTSLKEVIIPEGLKSMGGGIFEGCNLDTLKIPSTVEEIYEDAFGDCTIQNIINESPAFQLENGVLVHREVVDYYGQDKEIVDVIKAQSGIESYDITGDVFEIYPYAFYGCNIKSITMPAGIAEIGNCAFENCKLLEKVEIAEGYNIVREPKYGPRMFSGCESLKEVPIYIREPNYETYYGCTGIKRVDINSMHNFEDIVHQFDSNDNATDFYIHWSSGNGTYPFDQVADPYANEIQAINEQYPGHIYFYDDSLGTSELYDGHEIRWLG